MSKGRGKGFEEEVRTTFVAYAQHRLAYAEKIDPPTLTFGRASGLRVIHKKNPFLDFTGSWVEFNGASMHFECKETAEPRLILDRDGGLSHNQWVAMNRWHLARAVVFVLWKTGGKVRLLTVPQITDILRERQSATAENGYEVPAGTGFVLWDVLAVLRAIYAGK
jgi:penicillin-binding protein-related factor A (putative recombinase)